MVQRLNRKLYIGTSDFLILIVLISLYIFFTLIDIAFK